MLLEWGADINQADKLGRTPLFTAAQKGHTDIVNILLKHGSAINPTDNQERTPLIMAVYNGHTDSVKILLKYGASVNQANNNGFAPLFIAIYKGHTDIVKLLLEWGADVNQVDNNKIYPLFLAKKLGHRSIIKLLEERGAVDNIGSHENTGGYESTLSEIFSRDIYIDPMDLHYLTEHNNSPKKLTQALITETSSLTDNVGIDDFLETASNYSPHPISRCKSHLEQNQD